MSITREYSHARWHSRAGFLLTTMLVLLAMGGPFIATRGILTHGALFLPAAAGLVFLFGGPLVRLALASGRLDHRFSGRESLQSVQTLIRLVFACVLLVLGARACSWLFSESLFPLPQGALDYQTRELTTASTAWHTATTNAAWWGMGTAAFITLVLLLFARRKRLAGLSWIAGWLLAVVISLMLLGLLVGYSMQGTGALAALAAPVRLDALLSLRFWGDAAAVAMLTLGAQTGMLVAAGRGLPKRAAVGREARILVAGVTFLLVLSALAGLLLLSAVCYRQGIVPEPAHAAPGVLILDVIPTLGVDLFQGWPLELRPSARQVTLAWCFIVTLACSLAAASMLGASRLLPRDWRSRSARFGYAAALACFATLVVSLALGTSDAYLPLLTVMPALLAVIRVTMARRAGAGMRVVSVAFHSSRPWLERLYLTMAFRVARPMLLLAVLAVALSRREYSLMLAGFAVAFALIWFGSLRQRSRSHETGMLRAVAVGLLVLAPAMLAADSQAVSPLEAAFNQVLDARDATARRQARIDFENLASRLSLENTEDAAVFVPAMRRKAFALIEPYAGQPSPDVARDACACVFLLDPTHEDSLRLERLLLEHDGVSPFPRLDEAFSDYAAGEPAPLLNQLNVIHLHIGGERLTPLLADPDGRPGAQFMVALAADLREAYGASGPRLRDLRRYLLQRATSERSLLRPDPAPGIVYLVCFLLSAGMLAVSLMLGAGKR
ncbi:MAG: hypothetical protein KDB90_00485 [Planctomycetes bacterium]|nr:hypothetical protein [Planctomycetota bacterium]